MSSGSFCWRRARSCAPTAVTALRSTTAKLHVVSQLRHRISSHASSRRRLALSLNLPVGTRRAPRRQRGQRFSKMRTGPSTEHLQTNASRWRPGPGYVLVEIALVFGLKDL